MHYAKFAKTSNVSRFLAGITILEERGAGEAGMLLVKSEPGYGKTRTTKWWTVQEGAAYVRATASMTPNWLLREIARELSLAPEASNERLMGQVVGFLSRNPRPLVVDEVEHTMHDRIVLETVRDISDLTEIPVVLVGMEKAELKIKRYAQISSRIAHVVTFLPASIEDVKICCDTLCEVEVAEDLAAEIHRQTGGRVREILNALALVERHGKRNNGAAVKLADMAGQELTRDWQNNRPRLVGVPS